MSMQRNAETSFPQTSPESSHSLPDQKATELGDDDLLARIKSWYMESEGHIADWRAQATEDFDFAAGNQIEDQDRKDMIEDGKPPVVFDHIGPIIDAVRGLQINNIEDVVCKPTGPEDGMIADAATHMIDQLREACDARDEESTAFDDCAICGLGVLECRIDEDGDRTPILERLSPLEVGWDSSAKKRNYIDRRYDWIAREIDIHEARAQFPDVADGDLSADWANYRIRPAVADTSGRYPETTNQQDKPRDMVRLLDFQWWERRPMMRVTDRNTGIESDLTLEQGEVLVSRMEQIAAVTGQQPAIDFQIINKKVWHHAIVGSTILYRGELPIQDGQGSRKFLTGKINRSTGMPYGLVRNAKDPQRLANKFWSQGMHILNTNAKSGILFEDGAFEDEREAADEWGRSGAMVKLAAGGLTKVKEIPPPGIPTGSIAMFERAMAEINQVTGVNIELLGLLDRDQAGVETHQRKQSAVTNLAWAFDALRIARKDAARSMLIYAMEYTPEPTLMRMVPKDMAPLVRQMRETQWIPRDISIDEAPHSPNAKERAWAMFQPFLQVMAQQGLKPETLVTIMRASPMPTSVVEEFAKTLLKAPDPQEVEQQRDSAARMARMQDAEAAKDEADALYKRARAEKEAKEFNLSVLEAARDTIGQIRNRSVN